MGDTVLLTGITGFVGSHIAESLIKKGYQLIATVRNSSNIQFVKNLNIDLWKIDWSNQSDILNKLEKVDYIIHCAGAIKALNYQEYYNSNVVPTEVLVQSVLKLKSPIKRFILISSQASTGPSANSTPINENANPQPVTDYGKTKLEAEKILLSYQNDFPITILRPCSIYGPRDNEFFSLFNLIKYHLTVLIGDGTNQVNMIHVRDFVDAVQRCIEIEHPSGSTYFVTDGVNYTWNDVFNTAKNVYQKKTLTIKLPLFIPKIVGSISEFISSITKKPYQLNKQKINEMIPKYWLCSSQKIINELGFSPQYNLRDGFQETINWYIQEKWL